MINLVLFRGIIFGMGLSQFINMLIQKEWLASLLVVLMYFILYKLTFLKEKEVQE